MPKITQRKISDSDISTLTQRLALPCPVGALSPSQMPKSQQELRPGCWKSWVLLVNSVFSSLSSGNNHQPSWNLSFLIYEIRGLIEKSSGHYGVIGEVRMKRRLTGRQQAAAYMGRSGLSCIIKHLLCARNCAKYFICYLV